MPGVAKSVLVVVAAGFALAQTKPPPLDIPLPIAEFCVVAGRVTSKTGGEALGEAQLTLGGVLGERTKLSAKSDAEGRFRFEMVPPGLYRLTVQRQGFLLALYRSAEASLSGTSIRLAGGEVRDNLSIELIPHSEIHGSVRNDGGEPLAGAMVQLLRPRYLGGEWLLVPYRSASAGKAGEYRLSGFGPGRYYLIAGFRGRPRGGKSDAAGFAPTFFPDALEPADALPVEVGEGAVVGSVDIRLHAAALRSVRGVVIDEQTQKPLSDFMVSLVLRPAGPASSLLSSNALVRSDDGSFELSGILPGTYSLTAAKIRRKRDEPMDRRLASLSVEVGEEDVGGVILAARQPLNLDGRFLVGSEPLGNLEDVRVFLRPVEGSASLRGVAQVQDDGRFHFSQLARTRYRLSVYGLPETLYVSSVHLGDVDALEADLDLTEDPVPGSIDIGVGLDGKEIGGGVVGAGEQPAVAVLVTLVPERQSKMRHRYKVTRTDIDGSFRMAGVAPGRYRLYAWEEIEPGAYQSAEFLEQFEKYAVPVSVEKSGLGDVRVTVVPGAQAEAAR